MACHDVATKVTSFVTNISHIGLSTFVTKQHHLVRVPNLATIGSIDLVMFWMVMLRSFTSGYRLKTFDPKSSLL